MASIIISLLVQLLIAFLKEILKKWLNPEAPEQKNVFMQRVQRRWWLGKKRSEYAEKLYDKMVDRHRLMPLSSAQADVEHRVAYLTNDLTLNEHER